MSPLWLSIIEWSGSLLAVIGAGLLATRGRYVGYGFVFFLVSNVFWITYALAIADNKILFMQIAFTFTSLLGIYRWLFTGDAELSSASRHVT